MNGNKYIDPRGINRKVIAVDDSNGSLTLVSFDCGHTSELSSHFHYKIGSHSFCFRCGMEAKAAEDSKGSR